MHLEDVISVDVAGKTYHFTRLESPLKEMQTGKLVIMYVSKRKRCIEKVWMCDAEIDYDLQGHMENILVSPRTKWFTKDYAMTRIGHIDERSVTITGPDKKSLSMSIMGDTLYTQKHH